MFFDSESKSMIEDSENSESIIIEYYSGDISVKGLFDLIFMKIDPDTGAEVMVDSPHITLYYTDILAAYGEITNKTYVRARGNRYRVKEVQPDGSGIVFLELKDE